LIEAAKIILFSKYFNFTIAHPSVNMFVLTVYVNIPPPAALPNSTIVDLYAEHPFPKQG